MIRWFAALLFLALSMAASDCQAQRPGLLFRNARIFQAPIQPAFLPGPDQEYAKPIQPNRTEFRSQQYYSAHRNPTISRLLDGKTTGRYRNPAEVDARYIGGFHQSHFNNIGMPSGDIGLRGNALNWRTW